jgi:thioredoxin reductase (NADPH)
MYDVAVVGGGPAGGSAAIFLAKAGMKTLVLDNDRGQTRAAWLLNHYGFADGISGPDLVEAGRQQSRNLGAEWVTCQVSDVQRSGGGFTITAENGDTYEAKQVVLATGAALALGERLNLAFAQGRETRNPKVLQVDVDGRTSERGIWAAGIIAGCSAHTIITCGHGAQVAVGLLSDALGKRVVQHDVLERANQRQPSPVDLQDHVDSEQHRQPPAQQQLREHMQTQHDMQGQGQTRMPGQGEVQSQDRMNPQERIQSQSHMQSQNPTESQTPQPTADMRQPGQLQPQGRMQPQIANADPQQTEKEQARQLARQAELRQEANDRRFEQAPQLRDHQGPQREQPSDPQQPPSTPQQPPKQH